MALPSPGPALAPEFMAHNDGPALLGGVTTLMVLAIVSVVLRFWIRRHRGMELLLDDWLIGASMVPFLGLIICAYCSVFLAGVGKHYQVNVLEDPSRPTTQLKIVYVSLITIVTNISLVKLSIIAMYHRIFPTRFMRWSYIILGTIIVVWAAVALPVCIFQCRPIEEAWDFGSSASSGTCISAFPLYFGATGLPNVAIDLVLLCLPMYEVWKLQIPRAQKVAIVSTFLLGAVVIVADVFKLVVLVEIYDGYENQDDQHRAVSSLGTDKFQDLIIWIVTEHALSIICANIPSLRPVLIMFLGWTGVNHPKPDLERLPRGRNEGLVTIGGSGASRVNLVGKRYDSDKTDWTGGLGQESPIGEDSDEHTYRHGPVRNTIPTKSVIRSDSVISTKSIIIIDRNHHRDAPQHHYKQQQQQQHDQPARLASC
ncbi:hypothetical protein QBC37DRAFT_281539 [Rhypophila decipiens]|uniref:Rhodopsin domain-containing protein n=1 Tax=Rhypophila decipiens TaxID=261697 RepID=A0AAN7B9J4_9PEZI|nr:hypothetical protein QBC37DRAFT_281539 [Rhypophila decipiens]